MKSRTAVVIDNDDEIIDDFMSVLPVRGIKTATSFRSKDDFDRNFRRRLRSQPPAIFFVDLRMEEDTSGLQILRYIRRSKTLKGIPVVIISNSDEDSDIVASYESGANIFVSKGENPKDFPRTVRALLKLWTTTGKLLPEL